MRVTERCGTCRKTDGWHGTLAAGKAPVFHHVHVAVKAAAGDVKRAQVRLDLLKAAKAA